jgi:hypothetical protein
MTQFGMYSAATTRNDPSYSKGQWDIADADRYLSEAYGGYHIDGVGHGMNFDAGIFMSYVGLFSYYNFDNWAYQPSYVSSNTPWFFEGIRLQFFPTEHLKIEPWIINGWQSYGSSNSRKGLGGQVKRTPYSWMNIVSNNYGLGHDDFFVTNRGRIHTDNSIEIKYFDKPAKPGIDKMAFSFTGDMGCEFGPTLNNATTGYSQAGVSCLGNRTESAAAAGTSTSVVNPKQSFIGWMLYDRIWTGKDHHGFTVGGGQINNRGVTWCWIHLSTEKQRLQRPSVPPISPEIQVTHSRPGTAPSPTTTCRSSGTLCGLSTAIGIRTCPTGQVMEALRLRPISARRPA